ncbi:hypothetical protein CC2G_011187 [Coprinopsis cinerea AmutBmut pab1-1]|nr:hypothetical protein CC2G_011187 [Coprinopsis cinerea AmutBmut pab1-1]
MVQIAKVLAFTALLMASSLAAPVSMLSDKSLAEITSRPRPELAAREPNRRDWGKLVNNAATAIDLASTVVDFIKPPKSAPPPPPPPAPAPAPPAPVPPNPPPRPHPNHHRSFMDDSDDIAMRDIAYSDYDVREFVAELVEILERSGDY